MTAPQNAFTSQLTERSFGGGEWFAAPREHLERMHLKRLPFLFLLLIVAATAHAQTQPLRLTVGEAIRMALGTGTQAELARSNEQLARIARAEAFNSLLPQADARVVRYNQSINLETFGFSLPGLPPTVG